MSKKKPKSILLKDLVSEDGAHELATSLVSHQKTQFSESFAGR